MKRYITVIDPAVKRPEVECLNELTSRAALPLLYHLPAISGFESLQYSETIGQCMGIIVLGSRASVHDPFPWIEKLGSWLKLKIESSIPTLGLCFGHQLISHIFGGEVAYVHADHHKNIGFRDVILQDNALSGREQTVPMFVSHCEFVRKAPENFSSFGKSLEFENDGLKHRDLPCWSFQPHPESVAKFIENQKYKLNENEFKLIDNSRELVHSFIERAAAGALIK